jgi:hypothetical protein
MKLLFHPAALNEMIDAANYYEHQRDGLGGEFDVAIEAAFAAILRIHNGGRSCSQMSTAIGSSDSHLVSSTASEGNQ